VTDATDAMKWAPVTVREVVRLLLEADSYPRLGNEDWPVAARMEAAAIEKPATAVPSPDDPPEFGRWLEALRRAHVKRRIVGCLLENLRHII
jgi:hypothetical protein